MIRENFAAKVSKNEPFDTVLVPCSNGAEYEKLQGYTIAVSTCANQTCHTPAMTRSELREVYEVLKAEFGDAK